MFLTTPEQTFAYFNRLMDPEVEEFWVAALAANRRVIKRRCLFRGTVDQCLFHPRDVIRFACMSNASSLLVAHNHPTGDPTPSREDHEVTERLFAACELVQIALVDHVIVGRPTFFSFWQSGALARIRDLGEPSDQSLG